MTQIRLGDQELEVVETFDDILSRINMPSSKALRSPADECCPPVG